MFNRKINQRLDKIEKELQRQIETRECCAGDHKWGEPEYNPFRGCFYCSHCGTKMTKYACETWLEQKKEEMDSFFKGEE